jgi:hypothetical protein
MGTTHLYLLALFRMYSIGIFVLKAFFGQPLTKAF